MTRAISGQMGNKRATHTIKTKYRILYLVQTQPYTVQVCP